MFFSYTTFSLIDYYCHWLGVVIRSINFYIFFALSVFRPTLITKFANMCDQCFSFQFFKRGALATTIGVTEPHMDGYTNFIHNYIHPSKCLAISSNCYDV